jgi:hypothetical protein
MTGAICVYCHVGLEGRTSIVKVNYNHLIAFVNESHTVTSMIDLVFHNGLKYL